MTAKSAGWHSKGLIPLGYLGDPEKTARTFPVIEGIRHAVPGDRARWHADGRIELLGRDAVTINSGGEKIFAEEVEAAIARHADVYDVVVTSRPSQRWGNEVVAVVQLADGATADPAEHRRRGRSARRALQAAQGGRLLRPGAAFAVRQGRLSVGERASGAGCLSRLAASVTSVSGGGAGRCAHSQRDKLGLTRRLSGGGRKRAPGGAVTDVAAATTVNPCRRSGRGRPGRPRKRIRLRRNTRSSRSTMRSNCCCCSANSPRSG